MVGNPYMFTGRRYDPEINLYYYRARMYNPQIGRFMQTDPIGYSDGINWYAYCGNNPVNYTDATGMFFGWDDALFAGGGALVGLISQGVSDLASGELSGWAAYGTATLSGAAGGVATLYGGPVAGGIASAAVSNGLTQVREWGQDKSELSLAEFGGAVAVGAVMGKATSFLPAPKVNGVNVGRGSYEAVRKQMLTKFSNGMISRTSMATYGKSVTAQTLSGLTGGSAQGIWNAADRRNLGSELWQTGSSLSQLDTVK